MKKFEEQLLRLQQALRVTEEQEVARLLGLSKAAFSARKSRDKFPEREVFALMARRPELKLDASYVITGAAAGVGVSEHRRNLHNSLAGAVQLDSIDPERAQRYADAVSGAMKGAAELAEKRRDRYDYFIGLLDGLDDRTLDMLMELAWRLSRDVVNNGAQTPFNAPATEESALVLSTAHDEHAKYERHAVHQSPPKKRRQGA